MKPFLAIFLSIAMMAPIMGCQQFLRESMVAASQSVLEKKTPTKPPPDPLAYYHYLVSRLKLSEGKIDDAIHQLKITITYDAKEPTLHVELATLYIHKGRMEEAIEECKTALHYDPDYLSAHLLLGGVYSSLRKTPQAIESYQKALKIDPHHRDTLEAVIAALYLDGGLLAAEALIARCFEQPIRNLAEPTGAESLMRPSFDYKTSLQELCQKKFETLPVYELLRESGPDHEKLFEVQLSISGRVISQGAGRTKKEAEQMAAKEALKQLEKKRGAD